MSKIVKLAEECAIRSNQLGSKKHKAAIRGYVCGYHKAYWDAMQHVLNLLESKEAIEAGSKTVGGVGHRWAQWLRENIKDPGDTLD